MIAYFDTSAFLKLIIDEPGSRTAMRVWTDTDLVTSGRLFHPEARAGLRQTWQPGRLSMPGLRAGRRELDGLCADVEVIEVTPTVAEAAGDAADEHGLRGYDAVHLASALHAGVDALVCADKDLLGAVRACGLAVIVTRS